MKLQSIPQGRYDRLAPFIEIKDLTVRFGDVVALNKVNLTIEEGESVGILGRSGSGKSVLMHVLRGVESFPGATGSVIYHVARCAANAAKLILLATRARPAGAGEPWNPSRRISSPWASTIPREGTW